MKELKTLKIIEQLGLLFKEFYRCKCPERKKSILKEIKETSEKIRPKT